MRGAVKLRGSRVAGWQRGVEPRRRRAVHQPGRAEALGKLELHGQKQRERFAATLLVADTVGVTPAFVLRRHEDFRHFGDEHRAQ